ncbi:hypothetical protein [Alterisphingorhabdus coralli]|uniref:Uncharacterized protein n=1 Tax=Alterisphingorhabdus coralli TaxID=3071408 RepID=A0AA97I0S7_9SPHN|nr:hypothetical protein [Parasphingorhabdus sp. SCSIO 66989]WOE74643.1 hypothetical protein RB602_12420 [Parasphingorhabdus sp. SCSIO 66989]
MIKSPRPLYTLGFATVLACRRFDESPLRQFSAKSYKTRAIATFFSSLYTLLFISFFLTKHCGPTRSDLIQCEAMQSGLGLVQSPWELILGVYDLSIIPIAILALCIASILKK